MPRQSKSAKAKSRENDERLQGLLTQFSQAVQGNQGGGDEEAHVPTAGDAAVFTEDADAGPTIAANTVAPVEAVDEKKYGTSPAGPTFSEEDGGTIAERPAEATLRTIALEKIRIGSVNAREISDEDADLGELVQSIRQRGVLQAVLVAEVPDGFRLIAGERRVRAARLAGLTAIPAMVKQMRGDDAEDIEAIVDMITENVQRKNFEPWEEAAGYERLLAHGMSMRKIAELVGKAPGYVSGLMKLARHPAIRAALESRAISTWSLATELNRLMTADGTERWDGAVEAALTFIRGQHPTVPELRGWIIEQRRRHEGPNAGAVEQPRRSGASFLHREELRLAKMRTQEFPRLSRVEIAWYRELLAKELAEVDRLLNDSGGTGEDGAREEVRA